MTIRTIATYHGRPVDQLSRDELIEAVTGAVREIEHLRELLRREEAVNVEHIKARARQLMAG